MARPSLGLPVAASRAVWLQLEAGLRFCTDINTSSVMSIGLDADASLARPFARVRLHCWQADTM